MTKLVVAFHNFASAPVKVVVPIRIMKRIREADVKLHSFLTSALDGGEWSTSGSSCLNPEKEPVTPPNVWVGPRALLFCFVEEELSHTDVHNKI